MSRGRAFIVWTLVVVAGLLVFVSSLTLWTKRQLLDTNAWTKASGQLLADNEVRSALSVKINDALYQRVDLTSALQSKLPEQAKGAAPVIATTIQNGSARAIDAFLSTSQAQTAWEDINRTAHTALVRVLEDKPLGPLDTNSSGDVVLNLGPMVKQVADRLGVSGRLAANVPEGSGQIVVLKDTQITTAQRAVKVLKAVSLFLVILVFALFALAIYLARGRRRVVLEGSGASLVIGGLLLLIAARLIGNALIDGLVKTDANRPAAHHAWLIATQLLHDSAIGLVVYGFLIVIAGILAGPSRPATWLRRELAPAFRRGPWIVHGVGLVLFLLLIAFGPTSGSRRLIATLVLAALFFTGLEIWRRMTLREFPAAAEPVPPAPPPPPVSAASGRS